VTRLGSLFSFNIPRASAKHGSLVDVVRRVDKSTWCNRCVGGNHEECTGHRRKKYERGYGPCECAAHGHYKEES
jgi:hypothetical protein